MSRGFSQVTSPNAGTQARGQTAAAAEACFASLAAAEKRNGARPADIAPPEGGLFTKKWKQLRKFVGQVAGLGRIPADLEEFFAVIAVVQVAPTRRPHPDAARDLAAGQMLTHHDATPGRGTGSYGAVKAAAG
jgi:hypothetical protein